MNNLVLTRFQWTEFCTPKSYVEAIASNVMVSGDGVGGDD